MKPYDAERARIAAKHAAGELSDKEHRQIMRAINRAEQGDANEELRHRRALRHADRVKARWRAKSALRRSLEQSLEAWQ